MENNQQKIIMLQDLGMLYPNANSKTKRHYAIYECYCGKEFEVKIKVKGKKRCDKCQEKNRLETYRLSKKKSRKS